MRRKRRDLGTNIAFLDVMACGLGAAVLLFLIVKHHAGAEPVIEDAVSYDGETLLMLEETQASLAGQIQAITRQIESKEAQNETSERLTEAHQGKLEELASLQIQIEQEQARNSALEREVVQIRPQQTADVIQDPQIGEEDYLIGLKVEGRRIAILLDRSASMTDAKLVDVIVRKLRSDADKQQGPKWNRTIRVARWLLARLPSTSQVAVIAFSEEAEILNGGAWADSRDAPRIGSLTAEIAGLVPTGGTNLEAGIRALKRLRPAATDVYIVTDGLPTRSVSSPGTLTGCRKKSENVSGRCRAELFFTSLDHTTPLWAGMKVNVILLPIEGDPEAAPLFWNWTARTRGLMLVPAVGWP